MLKCLTSGAIVAAGFLCAAGPALPDYVFTSARRFEPKAWMEGHERFPEGAALVMVSGPNSRALFADFFAAADPAISFNAKKILFAGKRSAGARWRIWEAPLSGGAPQALTPDGEDSIRPLYLPEGRIVYTRVTAAGSFVEAIPAEGGPPARLTFRPGRQMGADVLRDGRILFESMGELFTVYPDGTGFEALRCDHRADRADARQISSGDIVFTAGGALARFTSALAVQVDLAQPTSAFLGPVAEVAPDSWIVAMRPRQGGPAPYALYRWPPGSRDATPVQAPAGMNAVQPVIAAPRTPPRIFPSALIPTRKTGILLCLNARDSRQPIADAVHAVRAYAQGPDGAPVLLGQAPVEHDGSFYIAVPPDRPLRLELLGEDGAVVRAERGWFWMRAAEQRVCVGCHTGPERSPENKVPDVLLRTIIPEKLLGPQS